MADKFDMEAYLTFLNKVADEKEQKQDQEPEAKFGLSDQGSYSIKEYQIRGRKRCRIVVTRKTYNPETHVSLTEEKQFWIERSQPAYCTMVLVRNTRVGRDSASHDGCVHPNLRYGLTLPGLARSTRGEDCSCGGDPELLAYWKSTNDTIQHNWDRFHPAHYWAHVHGTDYSGLGMYGGSDPRSGKTTPLSDDDEEDPILTKESAAGAAGAGASAK